MKKAAFVISIVALSVAVVTLGLMVLEMFYKKTAYIDSDKI